MSQRHEYRFSVTAKTDDLSVLYCLRALSMVAQTTGNNMIPGGHTKNKFWKLNKHQVTFHFSSDEYRSSFITEARRLLPPELWVIVNKKDNDPPNSL